MGDGHHPGDHRPAGREVVAGNIMPVASFDAESTEWKIAHLLDRDDDIAWWLRLYSNGPAFIPTSQDGNYFPDFITLDNSGVYWLIEGKSDRNANDADVLRKKETAEHWARSVTMANSGTGITCSPPRPTSKTPGLGPH
ncbi:hypothetical protein MTX80_23255 (plasmid) [Gordonia amicalis]|nr:hypothetical protein [Gordonia amicalis]UOG23843.1 hypothetical protein MTX80_23255 [Gordonia amicalis]